MPFRHAHFGKHDCKRRYFAARHLIGFAFQDYRKMHWSLLQLETKRSPNPRLFPASQSPCPFRAHRQVLHLCPIGLHPKFQLRRSQYLCKGPEPKWKMWVGASNAVKDGKRVCGGELLNTYFEALTFKQCPVLSQQALKQYCLLWS